MTDRRDDLPPPRPGTGGRLGVGIRCRPRHHAAAWRNP